MHAMCLNGKITNKLYCLSLLLYHITSSFKYASPEFAISCGFVCIDLCSVLLIKLKSWNNTTIHRLF